jgi:hypothetical protein
MVGARIAGLKWVYGREITRNSFHLSRILVAVNGLGNALALIASDGCDEGRFGALSFIPIVPFWFGWKPKFIRADARSGLGPSTNT